LIRTEIITADKKQFFQEQSQNKDLVKLSFVVEGANLQEMNMEVSYLLIFLFITGFIHVLSGVIINIIIFFNVLLGTYEKEKVMRW
jgi:cytochrome c oxidase subunit 3